MPKAHRVTLASIIVLMLVLLIVPTDEVKASRNIQVMVLQPGIQYDLPVPKLVSTSEVHPSLFEAEDFITHKVRNGDTIAQIFSKHKLSPQLTYRVSKLENFNQTLKKIKPGDVLYLQLDEAGQLASLKYPLSSTETLEITQQDDKLVSSVSTKQVEKLINFAQGTITSSFWNAGMSAGLTDNQIMRLAGIFGWDIDFAQEIRSGDSFNMAFEELYVDGEFIGYGDILAAEFVNQGEAFTAIRYTDGNYYTPEGRSMRKSFLRAPINFRYVSSNFNPKRFHPVQKRIKPHRGVDYVAPTGTPVVAAGDGKVTESGYNKFNGNYVFIQHGERYTTKYLHLKRKSVKRGQWVKQGQTVGTLGSSGMVTGAHLHYEFLVDGVHRNPRTVSLPKAKPIDAKEKSAFMLIAQEHTAMLENNKRIMLAMR